MAEIDYLQPSFYRFSEDSVLLSNYISSSLRDFQGFHILDLCAGCGVVSLELCQKISGVKNLTFLEKQEEFRPYLEKNIQFFLNHEIKTKILIGDFNQLKLNTKYDLIVCNPPYFFKEEGKVSINPQKAIARSFSRDDFAKLFEFFRHHLLKGSKAIFCGPKSWVQYEKEFGHKMVKEYPQMNIYLFNPLEVF